MTRRTLLPLAVVFAIILLTPSASSLVSAEVAEHKPFGSYHVDPESKILYPRIGAPAIVKSGSSFSVYLKSEIKEQSAWGATIRSLFDRYDLAVEKAELGSPVSEWKLVLLVPDFALRGLYNLTVYADKPSLVEYFEPNGVFVVGPSYPDTIRVGVISDTHYGIVSYYDVTTRILRRTIDVLNAIGLDLVIGAGDMTDATVEEEVFLAMRAELVRLRVPILLAPGNNDYQSVLRGAYLWEKYLAPNSASLDFGRYRFVTLDSRMGSIADEQLQWAEVDLASAPAGSFKVLVFHHPYWTETHPSLSTEIPRIVGKYGVGLVLGGHWHVDRVELTPTLSIVTTSLSTSDQFVGYRLLNLTSAGAQYTSNSLPYTKLNVTYLQRNDFSSTGGAVLIENGLVTALNFTLTFLLRNSAPPLDRPYVESGSILRSTATGTSSGREAVQVSASVGAGQRQVVKAYYEVDSTPPNVSIGTRVEGSTIFVSPGASDVGLGVLSLRVFYSEDNRTWFEVIPKVIDRVERWAVTSSAATVYFKAEAVDAAGLRTVKYVKVELLPTTPVATRTIQGPTPEDIYLYSGILSAIAVIALIAFLTWRRRKTRS